MKPATKAAGFCGYGGVIPLFSYLHGLHYSAARLFPGYKGVAEEIEEEMLLEQAEKIIDEETLSKPV